VHQCRSGPAEVTAEIHVAHGSYFEFFPDPYILFTGAELVSRTRVHVEDNAGLVIFDGFLSHDHRNDGGPFGRISSEISVLDSGGLPIAIDRYEVTGEQLSRQRVGEMQDYGEQSGLLAILAGIDLEDLIRDLRAIARDFRDVMVGISRLSGDRGISARLIGRNNIEVKRCKQEIWKAVRSARYGLLPPIRAK
jgi:urease accessory protein